MSTLREEDIRPAELMDKQRMFSLVDAGRMLSRLADFVQVNCPACQSSSARPKFEKNGIRYVECEACDTFFVNPRPTPNALTWFYRESPNYAYWNDVIFPASEASRRERIFAPRVDRVLEICAKYGVATDSLLEVGAGFGTFCSEINSRGAFRRVIAIEPTPGLAESCRKRGIEVIEKPVEEVELASDELFDVVANFEVIEHLFAPAEFIQNMARLLRPGGLMVLTCPNGKGFDVEVLGTTSSTVDHEHLNYFNPASLSRLLSSSGLETLESFTPGRLDAELVRNAVLAGEYDLTGQPFLKHILIDEWDELGEPFQRFLVENQLSSNMWLVARRTAA